MNIKEIKSICRRNNFVPLRRRGQNFLVSPKIIEEIVSVAEINKEDVVLEIGSGLGVLTKEIADRCKRIVTVEIDQKLVEILRHHLSDYKNIEIIKDSILDGIPDSALREEKYKVVANLPFNITGRVLRILLEQENKPELIAVIVQKEVAERVVARPPYMSLLSLAVQFYGQVSIVFGIKKDSFWPQPRVDSTVLKIKPNKIKNEKRIKDIFFQIIKSGFSSKRKYLLNNLFKSAIMQDRKYKKQETRKKTRDKTQETITKQYSITNDQIFKHIREIKNFNSTNRSDLITGQARKKQKILKIFKEIGLNEKVRAQELSLEQWMQLASKVEHWNIWRKKQ